MQSLAINGLHYAFKWESKKKENGEIEIVGNVLFPIAKFFGTLKHPFFIWAYKPMFSCVRCMSSFWGAVTFFPFVIWIFGFQFWQIGMYAFDVLILCTLNWLIYKKT